MELHISCAVIGEGNLLLCCLRDLMNAGIKVKAAFTNTASVSKLCEKDSIQYHRRGANIHDILLSENIDYLFSISNPRILKEDVLKIPTKLTINYHDSPLPAYAGVHATSWAIMNGERVHGISWHVVETGIDTGDILQSEIVEILTEDSALTLNLKCQEAAKLAFQRLVNDITHRKLNPRKQSQTGRTYFGLNAMPSNLGVLNFEDSAINNYNLARGLEFGNHENGLGSPKIQSSRGIFYLVTNVIISENSKNSHFAIPGTILNIVDDTLEVATETNPLLLTVGNLDGSPVLRPLHHECGFVVGESLKSSFRTETDALVPLKRKESFWRKKMAVYEPTVFYRQKMNVVAGVLDASADLNVKSETFLLPSMEFRNIHQREDTFLVACFVAFLARINCTSEVHIGLTVDKTNIPHECRPLYSDIIPGIFYIDLNANLGKLLKDCVEDYQAYIDSRTFLNELFYRYPELRGQKRKPHHNIILSRKTHLLTEKDLIASALHESNMLLLFNEDNSAVKLLYHQRPMEDLCHIVDVLRHFSTFLNAINESNASKVKLQEISLMQENEMRIFYPISDVISTENTKDESLFDLVQRQCMLTPLSIVLKTTMHIFTYKKLSEEIDQMYKMLSRIISPSEGPREIIAIHLPNSIPYVVSLMSVITCKHAFLPIPIDLPPERIKFTLKDAGVQRMITTKVNINSCDLKGLTPPLSILLKHKIADEEIVLLEFNKDSMTSRLETDSVKDTGNQIRNMEDEDFSYVMYTSGSTGRPKGVKVKESSVINLAQAQILAWDLGPGDVIAQFASIGFDATISEIFTALLSGASLAILRPHERLGSDFVVAMNKMKVTTITLTPSVLNIYSPNDFPSLRKVITAGEACTLNTAMKWTSGVNISFFNAYGPTEGTVCATCHEYVPGTRYEGVNRELPIGKAIAGVQVYLFDDFMKPVPPAIVGEIYIGGRGLAHGYIGNAKHYTADHFVQNPLTNKASLIYKTGDHAFQDPDGNITFIGRLDDQVKIRGHRVDLSEIEQVLIQYTKIDMAVVVVHKCSSTKDLAIAAFVAPIFICILELKDYLSKVLPKYMIPTYIKKMDVSYFPKRLNGKINRKVLESDESVHENINSDGQIHLNEIQLLVAKHWCRVFNFDDSFICSLHRKSSFSEFGGNSLQLVLLLRLIEDDIKVDLSFTDLGTADTLEEFADVVVRRKDMKNKNEHKTTTSKEQLRELIIHDSELDKVFFPNPEMRRSVQIRGSNTVIIHNHSIAKHPKKVLLSGVTGFLGAFLLSEILKQTDAHVCCMVRETSETRGMDRVVDNMTKYKLWKLEYGPRISIVISDQSQKRMGIGPDIYKALCNSIDVIFMNAAAMNFNTPYEDHRVANVQGTKEFIRFAFSGVKKYLFTTSSLSVFLFPPPPAESDNLPVSRRVCTEDEFFDDPVLIEGGYGQSKWASERLVMQALDFLPGGAIFRPARVSGRSSDGVGPKNDLFASILYGMKKLGCYPDMDFPFDLTPVDYCATSIIEIAVRVCNSSLEKPERIYHLYNKDTFPFKHLFDGMNLRPCSLSEWRQELLKAPVDNKELISLTPFFMSEFWDKAPFWPVFATANTDKSISDYAKQLMKPSEELLEIYKKFFKLS